MTGRGRTGRTIPLVSDQEQRGQRTGASWLFRGVSAGRLFGIPVEVAPSWFVIAGVITWWFAPVAADQVPGIGNARYAVSAALALTLYGSVLVHELCHSFVARALGLPVRRIVLQLLGGVSEINREPETAGREYLVAMAGPLVSVLLAGVGAALVPVFDRGTVGRLLMVWIAWENLAVAVFNLMPGLPLDGGRVLRAGLWRLLSDKVRGTVLAANVGRGLAVLVAAAPVVAGAAGDGATSSWSLAYAWLLAWFIWTGASQTLVQTRVASALPTLSARSLARRALSVPADLPLAEALRRARDEGARALITLDGHGRAEGVVSEAAAAAVPAERRPWVSVSSVSREVIEGMRIPVDADGPGIVAAVRRVPASEYLVVDETGAVCGVLAQADVAEVLRREVAS